MVPRWNITVHQVRLARRRESRGGQCMEDVLFPPHSGCRTFELDRTKRIQDCRSSRLYCPEGRHGGQYPRVATELHKVATQRERANGAKVGGYLVAMLL